MNNSFIVLLYSAYIVMLAILVSPAIVKKRKTYVDYHYISISFLMIGWIAMEIVRYSVTSKALICYIYSAKFAFLTAVSTTIFFLIIGCFHYENKVSKRIKVIASAIPALLMLFAFGNFFYNIFRNHVQVEVGELTLVTANNGVGYYLSIAHSFILIIMVFIFVIKTNKKLPSNYRGMGRILLLVLVLYGAGYILEFFCFKQSTIRAVDFNIFSIVLCCFIFSIAIYSSGRGDYLSKWKHSAFNYFVDPVLVLDEENKIVSVNKAAKALLSHFGIEKKVVELEEFWEFINTTRKAEVRTLYDEDRNVVSEDLYILNNNYPTVYRMDYYERAVDEKMQGRYLVFTDVTKNRLLIERLRDSAGVDGLTGIPNRYGLNQYLREVDRLDNLPISVIVGDVNGLKQVNDRLGHDKGDELIKEAASIFRNHTPKDGFVARAGGDEFVVILKKCNTNQVKEVIREYEHAIGCKSYTDFRLSIALGAATKTDCEENIYSSINKADANMYTMKRKGSVEGRG
ncbi:diguanylate cyclase (GGDEF)-like protein [Aequitasia blattaphilus]|uniref:Diguanylate cyclase n=1 Tax=Aequitasia blattaphilus TaxID=2949332 RepID=A0ABT1EAU0_9FIRM|nr:GGDEF domain-containing protein [Aequitasia blattaphilus]MCP1102958.1 diguanylate cyclase [Aequitasia blattaphilus]MCR8615598.1 diguanylate cyclase [Aequitasia blattaphilus]